MDMIYADHAATTPMHPEVVEVMLPYFQTMYGNPSSTHRFGREARQAIDQARATMANVLSVDEQTLIFTSGGTESANLAIIGYATKHEGKGKHIITSQVEHSAVLNACKELETQGFEVTYIPVDEQGRVDPEDVRSSLRDDTILVTIMVGNNEVGTVQPINEIGEVLRAHQAVFHSDAVQASSSVRINLTELPVDMLSISSHKINGPKGTGLLYVKKGVRLSPVSYGGGQERGRRSGTENVASIVGFSKAMQVAADSMDERVERYQLFSRMIIDTWTKEEILFYINGHQTHRLPHILNVSFPGVTIESLLMNLDIAGVAASSGSACSSGSIRPSHVLVEMFGESNERVSSAIRFSFGLGNTTEQMEQLALKTAEIVKRIIQQQQLIG